MSRHHDQRLMASRGRRALRHHGRWLAAGLIGVGLQLTACHRDHVVHHAEHPAVVQAIEGSNLKRVTLTEKAIARIDLKTTEVREQHMPRSNSPRKVVPYAALIYDPQGQTWIYTSPQPRTFIRHKVDVAYVHGDLAVLNDGPPAGTVIASKAVAESYGADFSVGH
jgi:hypothetical protein